MDRQKSCSSIVLDGKEHVNTAFMKTFNAEYIYDVLLAMVQLGY
jgi:hypothetical protein